MKFFYLLFNIYNIFSSRKKVIRKNTLNDESFHGLWKINKYNNSSNIIHLSPNGRVVLPPYNNLIGIWYRNEVNDFNMIFFNNNTSIDTIYQGNEKNLTINGNITYGLDSPDYLGNFSMNPIFRSFHNITFQNNSKKEMVNIHNITGTWLFKNTYSNTMFLVDLFENLTWSSSVHVNHIYYGGTWNVFDSSDEINLSSSVRTQGDYIWLLAEKNKRTKRFYLQSDILYVGKITHIANQYFYNEDTPSDINQNIDKIASKINGSIIYGFELEPEISESFIMTRWWD